MKKLLLTITFLLWSVIIFAQTHTVARGETLQSIAAKYNLTEEQLIEANPGADKLFYVGLKLHIPEITRISPESVDSQTTQEIKQATSTSKSEKNEDTEDPKDKPGFTYASSIEYGFLPKAEGVKGTNYSFSVTIGGNYYFMHRGSGVFAGARIGYNSANYNSFMKVSTGSYITSTSDAHFITLPTYAGYSFAIKKIKLDVAPYAGIGMNFCVGGKFKLKNTGYDSSNEYETKFEKNVGVFARVGAQFKICGLGIGLSYNFPLNKHQKSYFGKDPYFTIGFVCEF